MSPPRRPPNQFGFGGDAAVDVAGLGCARGDSKWRRSLALALPLLAGRARTPR